MSRTPADRRSSTCEVGRTGQDTRQPIAVSRRTRCPPIKPLAPVTRTGWPAVDVTRDGPDAVTADAGVRQLPAAKRSRAVGFRDLALPWKLRNEGQPQVVLLDARSGP
jgi:hypothetical protein